MDSEDIKISPECQKNDNLRMLRALLKISASFDKNIDAVVEVENLYKISENLSGSCVIMRKASESAEK